MVFRNTLKIIFLLCFLFIWIGCTSNQSSKCEGDKLDERWEAIVENDDCSAEQKGEAYIALGGFNYFKWIEDPDASIIDVISMTVSNWNTKLAYFLKALELTRPLYLTGNNAEKTIYFFAAFLTLNVYMSGNLDNGQGAGTTALDGNIESSETDAFTGAALQDNSGSDGTILTPVKLFQFKSGDQFYIWDQNADKYYEDTLEDGSADSEVADTTGLGAAFLASSVLNQIVYLDTLTDPLVGAGDPDGVVSFTGNLLLYLGDLEKAILGLGIDSSSDSIKKIIEFRAKLDNGAQCQTLKNNPNLGLVELLIANTQKLQISDGSYQGVNNFSQEEFATLGEDATFDSIEGASVEPGIKMLFKTASGPDPYIPYWDGARPEVKDAMTNMEFFGTSDVKAGDGIMTFSEIICASELMSE